MITRCGTCREYHWAYEGAAFRPWCSFPCWWNRHKVSPSQMQLNLSADLLEHRLEAHGTTKPVEDCEVCEFLFEEMTQKARVLQFKAPDWERWRA